MCEKKKEENEKWIQEAKRAKTGQQVWEMINRERRRRRRIEGELSKEVWEKYCKKLLGGVDKRSVKEIKRKGRGSKKDELNKEEVWAVVKRLKNGKAMG